MSLYLLMDSAASSLQLGLRSKTLVILPLDIGGPVVLADHMVLAYHVVLADHVVLLEIGGLDELVDLEVEVEVPML